MLEFNNVKIKIAKNFKERLFGLMFKKNINNGLLFKNCRSIHTFFMLEEIDVIATDKNDKIIVTFYTKKSEILGEFSQNLYLISSKKSGIALIPGHFCKMNLLYFSEIIAQSFKEYDIIVPKQIKSPFTNAQQYAIYHNIFDLDVISKIIKDLFPKYYDSHIETLCNKCSIHPCNMFITKKETFNDMMNFVFTICFEFENRMNLHSSNDYINHINKNKSLYLKDFYPNNTVQYQARILGFISERLLEIYYNYNNLKIKEYDVNETEMKYGTNLYKHKN